MSTQRRSLGVFSQPQPRGPNGERLCFNCRRPVPKGKRFNCSAQCSEEWACKTSPAHMRYVVHARDKGVCAVCKLDTDALKKEYEAFRDGLKAGGFDVFQERRAWLAAHGIPNGRECSDWWDADHIVPVIKGGGECGLDNLRTLCIPCHQTATRELRAWMAQTRKIKLMDERDDARGLLADA